jgi:ATP-dependent RNA helicase DeaD
MSQLEEFRVLGVSDDILEALSKKGFETPSAIQAITIPHVLGTDKDIIAQAQTGTGKTAAFGIPVIQKLSARKKMPQAIVLVPTRELALQVTQELQSFNTKELSIAPIYGGAAIAEQLRRLKQGLDLVVGTPGRMLDHIRRRTLDLSQIAYMILDEADEMLNMGFIEDIEAIMQEMTSPKRVLLFSATMPDRIAALARNYMDDPDLLKVESKHITTDLTNQIYFEVREGDKLDALTRIIDIESEFYGIVFSRTKVGVDETVSRLLERGYAVEGLHGDISQAQREKILNKFKKKSINILVATDVAARGIDVNNLTHVINYSLPQDSDSYVHRIGRTGRAGNQGTAITFISPSEMRKFGFLKRDIKADIKLEHLPTPADVVAIKRNKIKEELYTIVNSENYVEFGEMADELLDNYPPRVALSALLRLAFNNELSESSYPEIRSINVDRKGKARIFIAVGSGDGFDPRKLVKLLKKECGLSDHNIDDIKIMADFSFVTVPFDQANKVVRALNQLSKGDRPIAKIAKDNVGEKSASGKGKREKSTGERIKHKKKEETENHDWSDRPSERPERSERPAKKSTAPKKTVAKEKATKEKKDKAGAKAKRITSTPSRRERREQKRRQ